MLLLSSVDISDISNMVHLILSNMSDTIKHWLIPVAILRFLKPITSTSIYDETIENHAVDKPTSHFRPIFKLIVTLSKYLSHERISSIKKIKKILSRLEKQCNFFYTLLAKVLNIRSISTYIVSNLEGSS